MVVLATGAHMGPPGHIPVKPIRNRCDMSIESAAGDNCKPQPSCNPVGNDVLPFMFSHSSNHYHAQPSQQATGNNSGEFRPRFCAKADQELNHPANRGKQHDDGDDDVTHVVLIESIR